MSFDLTRAFYALLHSLTHSRNVQYILIDRIENSNRQIPVLERLCNSGMRSKAQSSEVYFPDFTS